MSRSPMLGRAAGRHGSCCGAPPGIDCADHYKGKKAQRSHEKRQWQQEEEMDWRSVRQLSLTVPEGMTEQFSTDNHALEARVEGSFIFVRYQETPDAEIQEYAFPAQLISFVSFWPPESPQP